MHALREFGFDNFDYTILERVLAENLNELRKILDEKECYYIELYDSINNGWWHDFCDDIHFYGAEDELYRQAMKDLPQNPEYSKYFNK